MIDPIDASKFSRESPDEPSTAKALAASGRRAGVAGAGVLGSCNPEEGNFRVLHSASAPGSWQVFLPGAGHAQFADAGPVLNFVQDTVCGRGGDSRAQVAALSSTPMLAWFWAQLNQAPRAAPGAVAPSPLPAFFSWVERQQAAGLLEFEVKEAGRAGRLLELEVKEAGLPPPRKTTLSRAGEESPVPAAAR